MDPLDRHDVNESRRAAPAVKLAETFDVMRAGILLKRANLKRQHPHAEEDQIDALLAAWLKSDD